MAYLRKLKHGYIWRRIFYERFTEPLHLNLLAAFVAVFGSFRLKIQYDLVLRTCHAYGILKAADEAKARGLSGVSVIEFGVAAGGGLMNMCAIAEKVSRITGVHIEVYGFDGGKGMPAPADYRDHPEAYQEGDFPSDIEALRKALPRNGHLIIGDLAETVPLFVQGQLNDKSPIGYVEVDVDYYSSTVEALKLFEGPATSYLPLVTAYFDDVQFELHNPFAGELLAIKEFNQRNQFRKICRWEFLECRRVFRNAEWLKHMFTLHVMDHPERQVGFKRARQILENPYL